jgi:hypothetical protein
MLNDYLCKIRTFFKSVGQSGQMFEIRTVRTKSGRMVILTIVRRPRATVIRIFRLRVRLSPCATCRRRLSFAVYKTKSSPNVTSRLLLCVHHSPPVICTYANHRSSLLFPVPYCIPPLIQGQMLITILVFLFFFVC